MNDLKSKIKDAIILSGNLKLTPDKIEDDKHLVFDYAFDSLKYQVLIYNLEKSLNISIPHEDYKTGYFHSISGLIMYVQNKLYEK